MKLPIALLMLMLAPAFAAQEIVQTPAVPSDSKPNDPPAAASSSASWCCG